MSRARDIANIGDGIATVDIDDGAVTAAKLFSGFANGITQTDLWRLVTTVTAPAGTLETFERADDASFNYIGNGMSYASGIWSFPTTGIYLVSLTSELRPDGVDFVNANLEVSSDSGSNYDSVAVTAANEADSTTSVHIFVDVTNSGTFRVRVNCASFNPGSQILGNTDTNRTVVSFIRLGDT